MTDGPSAIFYSIDLNIRSLMPHECAILCASVASQGENSMARKVGQIIARGDRRWLIRVYLGRDHETKKRNYHNRTIRGSMREAQAYLTKKLRQGDLGRDLEGAKITLNEYFDRWLETAVKLRVRQKTCQDYDGILRRYIRPGLGDKVLVSMRPMPEDSLPKLSHPWVG
jgi:Phage integrase, N-terminal SAM-like domain